jgi:hypothetical protein
MSVFWLILVAWVALTLSGLVDGLAHISLLPSPPLFTVAPLGLGIGRWLVLGAVLLVLSWLIKP